MARKDERLYRIWKGIKARCNNESQTSWKHYGGRGIKVCKEWSEYEPFKKWALENGYTPYLSIDRINNDGNYEPTNCRWATRQEQRRNTRQNRYITYMGETDTIVSICEKYGKDYDLVEERIRRGWSIEDSIQLPKQKPRKGHRVNAPFAKSRPRRMGAER